MGSSSRSKSPRSRKRCPDSQVYNPVSGKCVKETGRVGKAILKAKALKALRKSPRYISPPPKPKKTPPRSKICPEFQVYNPVSGKCVKENGRVGKAIIKAKALKALSKSPRRSKSISPREGKRSRSKSPPRRKSPPPKPKKSPPRSKLCP